jgi:hypothetical protein
MSMSNAVAIESEGPPQKIDGPPRAFAQSQTHPTTHQPTFFFLVFFLVRFWGVSRQGEFKNTIKIFLKKNSMSKTFPKKSTKISMSILLFRGFGCFSAMGVQKHYKKRFAKRNHVETFFTKK